jgi:hypothetical protein
MAQLSVSPWKRLQSALRHQMRTVSAEKLDSESWQVWLAGLTLLLAGVERGECTFICMEESKFARVCVCYPDPRRSPWPVAREADR